MFKILEDQYKLYEVGEHDWGMLTISDNILEELSELNCNKHMNHLVPLSHFFEQPQVSETEAQSSLWDASFIVSKVKNKDNDDSIPSTVMETEAVTGDGDEKRNIEGSVGMFVGNPGGDGLRNESLNLICHLDEQMATVEQLSNASEQQVAYVLSNLSDAGLCHVCTLLCSMSASEQSKLGSLVCRLLLVPRLQENGRESCSRTVINALVKFTKCLPHLSCTEVLLPVMLTPQTINEKDTVLQIITEALSSQHKENLLRSFLQCEPEKLDEWQIRLLQELISPTCGDTARQQLVQLLVTSANDLAHNTRFTKLLISVIQQLGPGAPPDVQQKLAEVVSNNKSVLKKAAKKALHAL
ncbi:hypothetical protein B7P43_G14943 [Cryptotermes secundus]|uniref:Uncharacterized protein n=1 Tax=Cryptotermes secundus TaxID=105785 RepID=A0A2J7QRH1_9NEOP|nr:uncharacterized protein LOC111865847 isoform X1 [Cryptotermes secundus]PNF31191.1 hypothetical protein B7P43_G14943 [Cryptotermes secundus]